ncbi:MAG: acetate uptake transporter [Bacteroidales bacterium]|nr:acetate uptake transporter [Bacteroidales bacterium]
MNNKQELVRLVDTTTNPAAFGLCGFGMSTLLLNLHNVGLFPLDSMIMAMGIFFGGIAQVMVGNMEAKKNNMFGMVAFGSYGFFWIILIALMMIPKLGLGEAPNPKAMGWFLVIWGIFTTGLFIATFSLTKMMRVLFGSVVALFFLLAIADFTGNATIKLIAGIDGIFSGSFALFIALAMVINSTFNKEIIPLR